MSSSMRIKRPTKSSEEPQTQSPEPSSRHKPTAVKRRIVSSGEEYGTDDGDVPMSSTREASTDRYGHVAKRARRSCSTADSMDLNGEDAMDVKMKSTKKHVSVKKRRAAVLSSEEEGDDVDVDAEREDDEEFMDAATQSTHRDGGQGSSPLPSLDLSDADYDGDLLAARSKPVRRKNPSWKVRNGGVAAIGIGARKGTAVSVTAKSEGRMKVPKGKGKPAKKEEKEIAMKDERKSSGPPAIKREPGASKAHPPARPHSQVQPKEESPLSSPPPQPAAPSHRLAPTALPKTEDPSPPPAPAPTPPKKVKLPTIRKNKPPGAATLPPKPPPPAAAPSASGADKPVVTPVVRKPAATADFDLRDKGAWASIFKQTGGSTPRSGLSRREKEEERRKELYKMRDEARAKRDEMLKNPFDLQSSWDKINRFEERLRANRSSALHPNLFAAKFRDEWEGERRRGRERRRGEERYP